MTAQELVLISHAEGGQTRVPTAWRPTFEAIIRSLARGEFSLRDIAGVEALSDDTVTRIKETLTHYPATLVELPPSTWDSSVAMYGGDQSWDAIVDLWSVDGPTDLVLSARIENHGTEFRFRNLSVYVP